MKNIISIVVYLDDGGELRRRMFESNEEALEFIENKIPDFKAILINGSNMATEDHT